MQTMTDTRILMVEDEMCLAMMLEDVLSDAGYQVVRAARLKDAMKIARDEHIDAAILDVNLHGETVYRRAFHVHLRLWPAGHPRRIRPVSGDAQALPDP